MGGEELDSRLSSPKDKFFSHTVAPLAQAPLLLLPPLLLLRRSTKEEGAQHASLWDLGVLGVDA